MAVQGIGNSATSHRSGTTPAIAPARGRLRRRDAASILALALVIAGTVLFLTQTESVEGVYMAVHVVSVSVWVGGAVALLIVALLTERARDPKQVASLMHHMRRIGERVFTPASLLALASGIALVQEQGGGYGRF